MSSLYAPATQVDIKNEVPPSDDALSRDQQEELRDWMQATLGADKVKEVKVYI